MIQQAVSALVPNAASAMWIGLLVAFLVFGDGTRLSGGRNRALAGLLLAAPFFVHIFGFTDVPRLSALLFTAIFLITGRNALWGGWLALRGSAASWQPNISVRALHVLIAFLVLLGGFVAFGRAPDDAGMYTNLGAQRWTETGVLPYGDPLLKGPASPAYGAAATYGPVLYAAHIPIQKAVGAQDNPPDMDPMSPEYRRPRVTATQITCFIFYLVGLASLYVIVRRLASEALALGAVALFAGSPYVFGLGGAKGVITGLAFISHIAPSATTLAAMAFLPWPFVSGVLLALGAGMLFYPAFLFPLWLGWLMAQRKGAVPFAAGFFAAGAVIAAVVVIYTPVPSGSNVVRLFLESTLEHQEGVGLKAYGASTFSFWGTHPALAAIFQRPLFGSTSLFKPTFLLFSALVAASFFVAMRRQRSVVALAGLTAMLAAAVQLWKTHASGSYVEWYYPFLIIALVARGVAGAQETPNKPGSSANR